MKTTVFAVLLTLAALTVRAQTPASAYAALPKDSATQKVAYSTVVQVPGVGKDELFSRARTWVAHNFVDSKAAARVEDRAGGEVIYHGVLSTDGADTVYNLRWSN